MKRVTGLGGLFFKSKDPKSMYEWYEKHLDALLRVLTEEGVTIDPKVEELWPTMFQFPGRE